MSGTTPPPPGDYGSGGYGSGGYGSAPPPPPPGGGYGGYGSPPPPPGYGPGHGGHGAPHGSNKKAIWALVLGILGLLCCGFFTGIPAIILGKQAQHEIDKSGGMQQGHGMATAGFVLGIIACAFGVVSIILFATGVLNFNANVN